MKEIVYGLNVVLVTAGLIILVACATPAQPDRMVPELSVLLRPSPGSPLREAILITKVEGGEETDPRGRGISKVGNRELEEAIRVSLHQHEYLTLSVPNAAFHLEVFLIELKQPLAAYTMIVDSIVRYRLLRISDGKSVYDDIITATYRATVADAFDGGKRRLLAAEGSVRTNIATFLGRLRSLNVTVSPAK